MNTIVIIGTGLAGYNLAKEIRKYDKEVPLTLITADGGESYSKPMLSNALSKGKTAEQLILNTAEKMAVQLNAAIYTHTHVRAIDKNNRVVKTDSGEFNFNKLVLAVGASQRKPPVSGDAVADVLSINDLDDYRNFQEKLEAAKAVAIIGAGLIGCEFANDLLAANKKIVVIGSSSSPLDRLLLPEIGGLLKTCLEEKGVEWKLGLRTGSVDFAKHSSYRYTLSLSNEESIGADLVLSATGLLPNIEIASQAGISINKGIIVDHYLATNLTDVYALGDCIEIDGMLMPYVLPLMNAARALAKTLTGSKTKVRYPAMPVVVKTPAYPIVVSPPKANAVGEWQLEIELSGARALFRDNTGKLLGFILTDKKLSEKQELSKQLPAVLE